MDIAGLKARIEAARAEMKDKSGHLVSSSEDGPIGIGWIENLIGVIEALENRIEKLEKTQGFGP